MIPAPWLSLIKKEKSLFNQIVFIHKQNYSNFKEEAISDFFEPYYSSLGKSIPVPPSIKMASESFEILLTLLQKGFLRDPKAEKESLLLNLFGSLPFPINENLTLTISYIINTLSKIKPEAEILFLKRLELLSTDIKSITDLKHMLVVLIWLGGHPEYRKQALSIFQELPNEIQLKIKDELKLESKDLKSYFQEHLFGNLDLKSANDIRYKMISGNPLLGGHFRSLPKLKMGTENLLACTDSNTFEMHFDLFGESVYLTEQIPMPLTQMELSPFWKTIITKIFPETEISSHFENEYYAAITIKFSYIIYIFYRASKS
jgi:hypothetical protein